MHRSSESVAALATALAKAQVELVNPEKSLTATISKGRSDDSDRSFRYAPLSSGLDIVRKTLGQHEIATLQTTAIDQTAGLVKLTTVLAHSSGEWIASDWPVCAIAETANPQRMGAALTYARRYALFTLVGIAGEDDLDAPDLAAPAPPGSVEIAPALAAKTNDFASNLKLPPRNRGNGAFARHGVKISRRPVLSPEESAKLRDRLLSDVAGLQSSEDATNWAHTALSQKDALICEHSDLLGAAFAKRLTALTDHREPALRQNATNLPAVAASTGGGQPTLNMVDKSRLAWATPRRQRNREHLRFVAQQPCLVCARTPSDAHHLRYMQPRALGLKASDEFTVPLCRIHHRAAHHTGDEKSWWQKTRINPIKTARQLWARSLVKEGRRRPLRRSARPRRVRNTTDRRTPA
jgi:hypothetical protein